MRLVGGGAAFPLFVLLLKYLEEEKKNIISPLFDAERVVAIALCFASTCVLERRLFIIRSAINLFKEKGGVLV